MLPLALLCLAQAPAPPTALDAHLREAERILVARVSALHEVEQAGVLAPRERWPSPTLVLAELEVERSLLGPAAEPRVYVLASLLDKGELSAPPQAGTRALWFLDPERRLGRRLSPETRSALEALCGEAPLLDQRVGGLWELDAEGALRLPPEAKLPDELARPADTVGTAALLDWIDGRLDALTPSLRAALHTTGPFPWSVEVDADGAWRCGRASERFQAEQAEQFWGKVSDARLHELPASIGRSPGPDSSWRSLELRTRSGIQRIRIHRAADVEAPELARLRERALSVWEALPGEGKP